MLLQQRKMPRMSMIARRLAGVALRPEVPSMRLAKVFEARGLHRRRFVSTAGLALVAASQSGLGAASDSPTMRRKSNHLLGKRVAL